MPIQYTFPSVTAAASIVNALPDVDEALSIYFRTNSGVSINRTPGGAAVANVGTGPTYSTNHASFVPFTAATDSAVEYAFPAMTFLTVWRRVVAGTGVYYRIFNPDTTPDAFPYAVLQFEHGVSELVLSGTYPDTTAATLELTGDLSTFRFIAGTIGGGETTKIYNLTDGTASADGGTGEDLYVHSNGEVVSLCSGESGGPTRESDMVYAGIVTEYMTEEQITAYYNFHKYVLGEISAGAIVI